MVVDLGVCGMSCGAWQAAASKRKMEVLVKTYWKIMMRISSDRRRRKLVLQVTGESRDGDNGIAGVFEDAPEGWALFEPA